MASAHTVATLVSLMVAIMLYLRSPSHSNSLSIGAVRNGLLAEESRASVVDRRVAVAFGGCLDVFVDAIELFDNMGCKPPKTTHHVSTIENQSELEQLFAYFFQHGAAAE